jgi:hypothetical protein
MAGRRERLEGWEGRLAAYLDACLHKPFAYGEHDCCLFAAGAVEAVTGEDPAAYVRGSYKTPAGAARRLAADFVRILNTPEALGFPMIPVLQAQRGDLLLAYAADGRGGSQALGVVSMDGRYGAFAGPLGLQMIPVRLCLAAWRVG